MNSNQSDYAERRKRQRFLARRGENVCFWVEIDTVRLPLNDVSLEGFSVAETPALQTGQDFAFALRLDGIPDRIRGSARAVNKVPGEAGLQIGCHFLAFEGDGAADLKEWLTSHVITSASVRITAKEAEAIVKGPSLV